MEAKNEQKKCLDLEGFSEQNILDRIRSVQEHGFGELKIEIWKGKVRRILETRSWLKKTE
jgi:hypothetical protein